MPFICQSTLSLVTPVCVLLWRTKQTRVHHVPPPRGWKDLLSLMLIAAFVIHGLSCFCEEFIKGTFDTTDLADVTKASDKSGLT